MKGTITMTETRVTFPPYTTAHGMTINRGYWLNSTSDNKALRYRKCTFPEGHYMKRTYGLDSMKITQSGTFYQCDLEGKVLGREIRTLNLNSPSELKDLLKSIKAANSLPKEMLIEGSSMAEMITNLLRIGRHVRL